MHKLTKPLRRAAFSAMLFCVALAPSGGFTQGLFSPVIKVNDAVVTGYELEQRALMLKALNAPGNLEDLAREQMIDDRLRVQAARAAGINPSEQDVLDGMTEFAGRANLSREEFVKALAAQGIAEQSFRDFVRAGLSWRMLVQAKFAGRTDVSQEEVDRALGTSGGGNVRVLLSEIIMPAPPEEAETVRARAERISEITSISEFSAEARKYSATATRGAGGRLPWRTLNELPPQLRPLVLALAPGEVTDPIPIPNAVALFQLRAIEETGYTAPDYAAIEYAAYYMPGGRSPETLARARVLAQSVDRCDDLYGVAKGQPPEVLERQSLKPEEIPADVAMELSKLDPGEVSTALTRQDGKSLMFLMLCGRTPQVDTEIDRDKFAVGLRNQRLNALSDSYLAQLRADARIIEK